MSRSAALAKRRADYPPSVVQELTTLERDLGGRLAVCRLLTLAPLTKDLQYILGLLGDPAHDRLSLATICAKGNLLPGDLLKHLGAAALHRGQTLARQRIGEAIPKVVDDLMRRAAPYEEDCVECMADGVSTGRVTPDPTPDQPNPSPQICPACRGALKILYMPSLDRQRLAIDLAGLVERGGGISILNQQLNLGAAASGGSGALEQLQTLTDQILYGEEAPQASALDAEVTPVDPPAEPASSAEDPQP